MEQVCLPAETKDKGELDKGRAAKFTANLKRSRTSRQWHSGPGVNKSRMFCTRAAKIVSNPAHHSTRTSSSSCRVLPSYAVKDLVDRIQVSVSVRYRRSTRIRCRDLAWYCLMVPQLPGKSSFIRILASLLRHKTYLVRTVSLAFSSRYNCLPTVSPVPKTIKHLHPPGLFRLDIAHGVFPGVRVGASL
eukprot:884588-Rhodomonas_salina.2